MGDAEGAAEAEAEAEAELPAGAAACAGALLDAVLCLEDEPARADCASLQCYVPVMASSSMLGK